MGPLSGTLATAEECSKLPNNRRIVCCKADSECSAESTEALVHTHARQVLNQESAVLGTDEVVAASKVLIAMLDELRV